MPRPLVLLPLVFVTCWSPVAISFSASGTVVSADQCFDQAPTIVGTPGAEEVLGTEGPDVVVTNGAFTVRTLGGDDLLCVTGLAPPDEPFSGASLDTGEGNDRIDARGGEFPRSDTDPGVLPSISIFPGPGKDVVFGGPHTTSDGEVRLYVFAWNKSGGRGDADVIATGDEPDTVEASSHDVVHLGGGNDFILTSDNGEMSDGVFDGGDGRNTIGLTLWTPFWQVDEHHWWKINNRMGRLVRDGEIVARLSGFSDFDMEVKGPLSFVGSDLPETFNSTFLPPEEPFGNTVPRHHWPLVMDMRGGDDAIVYYRGGPDSRFDGGDGTDRFSYADDNDNCIRPRCRPDKVFLDFSGGTLQLSYDGGREVQTQVLNFENARWWSRVDGTIIGTDGPNKIVSRLRKPGRDMTIHGGRGDDYLRGGLGNDVLIGGLGNDTADGQGGEFDHCEAEVRIHCELG